MTVKLVPGVHVVSRDDDHVQVGLDPPARVIVRREPGVLTALADLTRGRRLSVAGPAIDQLLAALDVAGLTEVSAPHSGRDAGPDQGSVEIVDLGLGAATLTGLLQRSGVPIASQGRPPDLYVICSPGPLPRARLDDWLCEGAPHLVVAGTGRHGSLRLGPLVEPGVTACLRCVDATEAAHDPRRTLVIEQLAALPAASLDPALIALGLAWAAREAASYVAGRRPLTWSGSVDLDVQPPVVRQWERHPHCGCAWDVLPYR